MCMSADLPPTKIKIKGTFKSSLRRFISLERLPNTGILKEFGALTAIDVAMCLSWTLKCGE